MTDRERAMEMAHDLVIDVPGGPGYHQQLWQAVGNALLEAEARGVEWASTRAGYMECRDRAAALRAQKGGSA